MADKKPVLQILLNGTLSKDLFNGAGRLFNCSAARQYCRCPISAKWTVPFAFGSTACV